MNVKFFGATDVGQVRDHNEDNYLLQPQHDLVVVCDGMGGHAAGEVASQLAIETVGAVFDLKDLMVYDREPFKYPVEITIFGKLLVGAIATANQRIFDHGKETPGQSGMGTTIVACHFDNGIVSVCHVGDSRIYLIRNGNIRQITIDHSWVNELMEKHQITEEESENFVNKNVITRALGTRQNVKTDISQIKTISGDIFLLCSDGLNGMLSDSEMLKTVMQNEGDLQATVDKLIQLGNEAGGIDNITVCLAEVENQPENEDFEEIRRETVDWCDDEREVEAIQKLISEKLLNSGKQEDLIDTTALTSGSKDNKLIWLWLVIILLMIAIIVYFFIFN